MNEIQLSNGVKMSLNGYGVFQITDEKQCEDCVYEALKTGYRLIDTAACYGNERAVGRAIKRSELSRNEVFIVSKVWIQDTGYKKTLNSFEKTLQNLQTDYLDLYLIHMPYGDYHGSWKALEKLYHQGKVRAIGVCNFLEDRLVDLILTHEITPHINQVELHPFCQQKSLRKICDQYNVQLMAWAPFAQGQKNIFDHEVLKEVGKKYHKTPAQVILRWLQQNQIVSVFKSVHKERICQNFDINNFMLLDEDINIIEKLDEKQPLILNITSLDEVYRLHKITFEQ